MREVLYRAKPKNLNAYVEAVREQIAWVYGSPLVNRCNGLSVQIFEQRDGKLFNWEVEPETLGQWTGLTDKNGKKIFEGDILESRSTEDERDWKRWVVRFDDGAFVADCAALYPVAKKRRRGMETVDVCKDEIELYRFVIVGNIHESPKLLEVKDDGR